jgi:hypothetical protein
VSGRPARAGWITEARAAATPAGIALLAVLRIDLDLLIGASTIIAVVVSIRTPAFRPSPPAYAAAGLITGLSETATGIGGPRWRCATSTGRVPSCGP